MWGFCGCNRRREEREEVSPVRDMREFVEVRRPCNECDCHRNNDNNRVMSENMNNGHNRNRNSNMNNNVSNNMNNNVSNNMNNNVSNNMNNNRRSGCRRNRNNMNNSMVSPATSSFCNTQLEAARNSCVVNPLTNFSRCNNNNNM